MGEDGVDGGPVGFVVVDLDGIDGPVVYACVVELQDGLTRIDRYDSLEVDVSEASEFELGHCRVEGLDRELDRCLLLQTGDDEADERLVDVLETHGVGGRGNGNNDVRHSGPFLDMKGR